MHIVKYYHNGVKASVMTEASRSDFSQLYKRWKAKAAKDPEMAIGRLSLLSFEMTHESRIDSFVIVGRPDNWPVTDGEPA